MTDQKLIASTRALLSQIVDYAGLFPPSAVSMSEAVINYAAYKNSNYNWMLGRFVVPVSRLGEFSKNAEEFFARDQKIWELSVLGGEDIDETVREIEDFNQTYAPYAACNALEIKAETVLEIENIAKILPPHLTTYFEVPLAKDLPELIATLAIKQHRAKIRTGGITESAFPVTDEIARFMRICLVANVPFKATAGLHHPVRCRKALTYEDNAPEGIMHGFLNVFLAAGLLRQGYQPKLMIELLNEQNAQNFIFEENGILWRQEYFISTTQLKVLREKNIISFGSCSFNEPIEDLQEIGIL